MKDTIKVPKDLMRELVGFVNKHAGLAAPGGDATELKEKCDEFMAKQVFG